LEFKKIETLENFPLSFILINKVDIFDYVEIYKNKIIRIEQGTLNSRNLSPSFYSDLLLDNDRNKKMV
jgi:hypothetical protein